MRRFSAIPRGPRYVQDIRRTLYLSGPGAPPPGFVGGGTSASEWVIYWALAKIFDDPKNPRKPPFLGGQDWEFQKSYLGAYTRARGSSVLDFVVRTRTVDVGMRLQSERFHIFTTSKKQTTDELLRVALSKELLIVDLYEQDFIADKTGVAAITVARAAIAGAERTNPITGGIARRTRL